MPDIAAFVTQMTLEEKAALCTGASAWTTAPVERLGIPEMFVSDGPHGLRRVPDIHGLGAQGLPATCFPTASALASTWNVDLIREMGEALAAEAKSLNVSVLLGPGTSLKHCGLDLEMPGPKPRRTQAVVDAVRMEDFMLEMPVMSLLDLPEHRLGINALEIVEGLLRPVHQS